MMSEISGSDGYFGLSRTVRKSGGYSGFPCPVSTRTYGLDRPTRYVLVPRDPSILISLVSHLIGLRFFLDIIASSECDVQPQSVSHDPDHED